MHSTLAGRARPPLNTLQHRPARTFDCLQHIAAECTRVRLPRPRRCVVPHTDTQTCHETGKGAGSIRRQRGERVRTDKPARSPTSAALPAGSGRAWLRAAMTTTVSGFPACIAACRGTEHSDGERSMPQQPEGGRCERAEHTEAEECQQSPTTQFAPLLLRSSATARFAHSFARFHCLVLPVHAAGRTHGEHGA